MCCPLSEFINDKIDRAKETIYREYFEDEKGIKLNPKVKVKFDKVKSKTWKFVSKRGFETEAYDDRYSVYYEKKLIYYKPTDKALKKMEEYFDNTDKKPAPFRVLDWEKQHCNNLNDLSIDELEFLIKKDGKFVKVDIELKEKDD